jgi:predicted ATPase
MNPEFTHGRAARVATAKTSGDVRRIVFTGGPGGGKTTAVDIFRREFGDAIVIVPETATLLYTAGFPRFRDAHGVRAAQTAIFQVQKSVEDFYAAHYPDRVYLCDRGTLDGAAYWPEGEDAFFAAQGTTLEAELARYSAVLFFETAAAGGLSIESENSARVESLGEANVIDRKIRALYSRHPRFHVIGHETSFFRKIERGLLALKNVLEEVCGTSGFSAFQR